MKQIDAYLVPRFSPEGCPRCLSRFKGPTDFQPVSVLMDTDNLPSNTVNQAQGSLAAWDGDSLIQFLSCQHCNNITMVVNLDQRYVLTREEAEEAVRDGYTAILPVSIKQIDAKVNGNLSFWFRSTYDRLFNKASNLRNSLSSLENHEQRANDFERIMSPILADIIREIKKETDLENTFCEARNVLKSNWNQFNRDTKELLIAAHLIKKDLLTYAEVEADIDYVAPVLLYARALENELYYKLFKPFSEVCNDFNYEYDESSPLLKKSIQVIRKMCKNGRKPNLSEMAYCLQTLAGPRVLGNWFKTFVRSMVRDYELLFIEHVFPQRVVGFVNAYRNRWGIIGPITLRECQRCEEYLLYEPIRLLPMLADAV